MRYLIIIALAVTLASCAEQPRPTKVVASIGSCTAGTGGWGGTPSECRVTFTDGTRGTARAPIDVGDVCVFYIGVWHPKSR
jgi:hypothetical protein